MKVRCSSCKEYIDKEQAIKISIVHYCSIDCVNKKSQSKPKAKVQENYQARIREKDRKCRMCGTVNNLHVHHVIYRSSAGPSEDWNLITLCNKCHDIVHSNKEKWQPACQLVLWCRETKMPRISVIQAERYLAKNNLL